MIKISSFIFFLFFWIHILHAQNHSYPKEKEIHKRVNYLKRIVNQPLDENSDIILLGDQNPEFMLFSYAYTSYAMTNLAMHDSIYKKDAIDLIKTSITKVLEYKISFPYQIEQPNNSTDSIPTNSVLYLGHLNLMIGCYRLLSSDTTFNKLNDTISKSLFVRYNNTSFLNLESYASAIWIPDNTVALASLKLHGTNTSSGYDALCTKWVQYAKAHYLDEYTQVLYSTIDPANGEPLEGPRGSMLGWSITFIYQFDSTFAIELYTNYKKHFSKNYILFRLFRERYYNKKTDMGDIDSGPIFKGYSIPANEFALSNAILAGDFKTARKLKRLINFGTRKIKKNNEIKYKVKFVKMNISPMAEALVLHSLTIKKWTK